MCISTSQRPILTPDKYNLSTHPLLEHLEEAGAGIEVDGELILGTAWSDDLMMLVEEDKLDAVLRCLETISGRYRKKTNDTKVCMVNSHASESVCRLACKLPRLSDMLLE